MAHDQMARVTKDVLLKRKAPKAYVALAVEVCAYYNIVKSAILKTNELIPEYYCQSFRKLPNTDKRTYVEFSSEKDAYFDVWGPHETYR